MKYATFYATNKHNDAVYKLEHNGAKTGIVASLIFTTSHGEESYDIDANEYQSFKKVFDNGSNMEITAHAYNTKRQELQRP